MTDAEMDSNFTLDTLRKTMAAVRSSELVVLLVRWDKDVALWERVADKEGGTLGERCRARAHEIANCRRELQEVINAEQPNGSGQRAALCLPTVPAVGPLRCTAIVMRHLGCMMDSFLWRMLMWIWVRRARLSYGGPGDRGELFNTACFQQAAGKTSGQTIGDQTAKMWLVSAGYIPGHGGCHWFANRKAAEATFPESA